VIKRVRPSGARADAACSRCWVALSPTVLFPPSWPSCFWLQRSHTSSRYVLLLHTHPLFQRLTLLLLKVFFKLLALIIVFAFFHGAFVLPVVLSLIGPAAHPTRFVAWLVCEPQLLGAVGLFALTVACRCSESFEAELDAQDLEKKTVATSSVLITCTTSLV